MPETTLDFGLSRDGGVLFLTLYSKDNANRLNIKKVVALREEIENLHAGTAPVLPLVISGEGSFSVGADLNEIQQLTGPEAFEFARKGQALMHAVASYPAPVYAAITGYCMGGGQDLALACDFRIASPHAVFGHRGAALGLMTGWGGTQRLPRLVGMARALEMFIAAEKLHAQQALAFGLVDAVVQDPLAEALRRAAGPGLRHSGR